MANQTHILRRVSGKQAEALGILRSATNWVTELLYGGGGGGGKSRLGCMFVIDMCLEYQGIRGAIAREELKKLKETTLLTLFDQMQLDGLKDGRDYVYNQQANTIYFPQTKSIVFLMELAFLPSDPLYDRLGSYELTFSFIDEAQQVQQKAKDVLRSRLRYKLTENKLIPKQLMTCNPHKGYLYSEFFLPSKRGDLPKEKAFLKSLVTDNPFIDDTYITNLMGQPQEIKERLLFGNWEYDDDPSRLIDYDAIQDIFSNPVKPDPTKKYIIADIARMGKDKIIISYWEGLVCKRIAMYTKLPLVPDPNDPTKPSTAGIIQQWREQYGVGLSHILVDEDGVGGGVKDYLGCKGFINGSTPFRGENYTNLKSQCYFLLAKKANAREVLIVTTNDKIKELVVEELEQVKQWKMDKDSKLAVMPKDEVKKRLNRSPDFSDTLAMRMYFEFAVVPQIMWA